MSNIICAFPAMGKTSFVKSHKNSVDYDRYYFQYKRKDKNIYNPTSDNVEFETEVKVVDGKKQDVYVKDSKYPQNFIDTILSTPKSIEYIFCSTNKDILNALEKNEIDYYIILPKPTKDMSLPESYIKRYYDRFETDDEYSGMKDDEDAQDYFIDEIKDTYNTLLKMIHSKKLKHCKYVLYVKSNNFISDVLK